MSQNTNNTQENSSKSFLEMCQYVNESQIAIFDFVEQKKYTQSDDESEHHEELKPMICMFFWSLKMITCCYILFDKDDLLKNHKSLDILGLINQLSVDIQRRIEEKY